MTPLSLPIALLVLAAAMMHATWNAVTKAGEDRLLLLCAIVLTGSLVGGIAACFVELPDPAAWPYLAGSTALHGLYYLFLLRMYQFGDLSQTYPIARGLAPLLVGLLSMLFTGERLLPAQMLGLVVASGAISSLAWTGGRPRGDSFRAVLAAAVTGLLIGLYTFIDAMGVRRAGGAERFIPWTFLLGGLPALALVIALRRRQVSAWLRSREAAHGVVGGLVATLSYALVLWAMSQGSMAHVSALRETSVVFASWIGTRILGEPLGRARLVAAAGVTSGLMLLHLG